MPKAQSNYHTWGRRGVTIFNVIYQGVFVFQLPLSRGHQIFGKAHYSIASIANFVFASFMIFEKTRKKARLQKSTRKMRMVSRSWQNCLEGSQNCPQGLGFVFFFCPRAVFRKIFSAWGAGNLTTSKIFPWAGGCWWLELTDALFGKGEQILGARLS